MTDAQKEKIIDGRAISNKMVEEMKATVKMLEEKTGGKPVLGTILVGSNPASKAYVGYKHKLADRAGIGKKDITLPDDATLEDVKNAIRTYNEDPEVSGILLQLPLPDHLTQYEYEIINMIEPWKDADGLTAGNVSALVNKMPGIFPCTPMGIIRLLDEYNVPIEGARAVIMGRSRLVGKPMFHLLLNRNATATIVHSRTKNLAEVTSQADILVAAIGRPKFVTADMVKEGAVVIDVGINRIEDGSLVGDVDFDAVYPKAKLITPVPGGVGPMTVAGVINNTIEAYKRTHLK